MEDNRHIESLMLRYLNGDASKEETLLLHEWIAQSPSNADEFELTKRLWRDSSAAAELSVDTASAWQAVKAQTIEKQAKVISMRKWRTILAIAASALLLIGAYYYFGGSSHAGWRVTLAENTNKTLNLSDGSTIILRKGSKLFVSKKYKQGERKTRIEGEAYFEVKHDAKNPFVVITSNSTIKDIGTKFLVEVSDTAEQVTVVEGAVRYAVKKSGQAAIDLKAGEAAIIKHNIPVKVSADTLNLLSWQTKILKFNNTPLVQVARDLEGYYRIQVKLPSALDSIQITAEFRNEPLDIVIKELQLFTGLKVQLQGNILYISE